MAMSRRTLLRGIGTTLALPLLDGMVPALTAIGKTAGKPSIRLGAIYVPMGMIMENWTPKTTGSGFDLTPIMQPLAPFKNQLTVVSGLNNAGVGHPGAASAFLTDVRAKGGANILAGVSMDQLVAQKIGQDNKLPSLELGLESLAMVGDCENANCGYLTTLAYSTPTTPLPAETNPREVFERLFGDPENTTPEKRLARIKSNRSLLDSVTGDIADLQRRIGNGDRERVSRGGPRSRTPNSESRKRERRSATDDGSSGRSASSLRRPREADVRSPGAGVPERLDARHHHDDGARNEQPPIPRDRHERAASLDDAQSRRGRAPREHHNHQHVSGVAARVFPRPTGQDTGR
jgi:hypothetical protein